MREFIFQENERSKEQSLRRSLFILKSAKANEVIIDGKTYLNFSSNDYLGYSSHPKVIQSATDALKKYGAGGRSSRLISGTLDLHSELEDKLSKFKGTESCLVFPTGFMANLGVISALLGNGDALIIDQLNHASIIDAAKLARCRIFVYKHRSIESLEKILKRTKTYKKRLVVTDSLFSMDGDFAPLKEIVDLCHKNQVWLMIDDAHATGIFGENGIGMAEYFNLIGKIEIVMGTLSKAMGSQGGFVCASKELVDFLINKSRPFIYTTALSPSSCAAALTAVSLVKEEPQRRQNLLSLSKCLRERLKAKFQKNSILLQNSLSQIVPFWVGSAENTVRLSQRLRELGIFAPAIRPPTVPKNECRLRFSLTSEHTEKDVELLLKALNNSISS